MKFSLSWIKSASVAFGCVASFCFASLVQAQPPQGRSEAGGERASQPVAPPEGWVDSVRWRNIGPANMSGRITALAVYEADPVIWWAASASGGLLKTTNDGRTFEFQFDREATVSIGDVQVFQQDPNIVWVGTGEANPRNSASWGNGVYRSTDGGETWTHLGLEGIAHTGRIALHPTDPNIAYVGALGRLWGNNEDRGLYKTIDGGQNWEKVLYVDDQTGVVDLQMSPIDPEVLIVATYQRQRDGFDGNDPAIKNGPGSALYMTRDGGKSFQKLTQGLPTNLMGRIGVSWYRHDPNYVYAIIETEKTGAEPENAAFAGVRGEDADVGARVVEVTAESPAAQAGLKNDDIIVQVDAKTIASYQELLAEFRRHIAGDSVKLQVSRDRELLELTLTFTTRPQNQQRRQGAADDTRAGVRSPFDIGLGGQLENAADQQGENGHEFGGVFQSSDGGHSWTRINSLNPRPMYYSQIRVDPSDLNHLYVCGTELYQSHNGGHKFTSDGHGNDVHVDHHALWIDPNDGRHMILGNDGGIYVTRDRMANWDHLNHVAIGQFYHIGLSANRDYNVYGGLQDNGSWGGPIRVGNNAGPVNSDWFRVGGGDGFVCLVDPEDPDQIYFESQNGAMGRINLRTGERGFIRPRPQQGQSYRFNWKTPFLLSPHNPRIHYSAGNYVFRSVTRGDGIRAISPEITRTDLGSGSAIAESYQQEGVVYVGTTDGWVWVSTDGGKSWYNVFENPDEMPAQNTRQEGGRGPGGPGGGQGGGFGPRTGEGGAGGGPGGPGGPGGGRGGRRGFNAEAMREMLRSRDANGDGNLSAEELGERMAGMIGRFDANSDGMLDASEIAAIGANPPGQGNGPGGNPPAGETPPMTDPPATEAPMADAPAADAPAQEGATEPAAEAPAEATPMQEPATEPAPAQEAPATETPAQEPQASTDQDPIRGTWSGRFINSNFPEERSRFTLVLGRSDGGEYTGTYESTGTAGRIIGGSFNAETNQLTLTIETPASNIAATATLAEGKLKGNLDVNQGSIVVEFEAEKTSNQAATPEVAVAAAGKKLSELVPGPRWVSSIEASRFQNGRVYMTLDGHRSDDVEPYVLVSEDFGKSWTSIRANLPTSAGTCQVIREDRTRADLLYLGCEFSLWVSFDRGQSWHRLNSNLPTVSVHEIAQHATSGDVVLGTHGRSIWVADLTTLRQFTPEVFAEGVHLFRPAAAVVWRSEPEQGSSGTRRFVGENPPRGALIKYSLASEATSVTITVTDIEGRTLVTLPGEATQGLHEVTWDLRREVRQRGRTGRGATAAPGLYLVTLKVDDVEVQQVIQVEADPNDTASAMTENLNEFFEEVNGSGAEDEGADDEEQDEIR